MSRFNQVLLPSFDALFSASSVSGVAIWTEEERDVVMLVRVTELEGNLAEGWSLPHVPQPETTMTDLDERVEACFPGAFHVVACHELDPIQSNLEFSRR
jgi:hypothetical protein